MHRQIVIDTHGRGMHLITEKVAAVVAESKCADGLCMVFLRHTSASILIQEHADPLVRSDMERFFARLVPDGDPMFEHDDEGPDDMPAHVRAALTQVSLAIPVVGSCLVLGSWQGIFLYEHRKAPHRRELTVGIYPSVP